MELSMEMVVGIASNFGVAAVTFGNGSGRFPTFLTV